MSLRTAKALQEGKTKQNKKTLNIGKQFKDTKQS